jgi:hypothetical protein
MTWQASWPPTRSRHDDRQPPDSNSSGVLGPARRGRGTVGDDLCVRPNHAALDPHERPVHWPSPRAQCWCSDGSPAKAASRSPARSSRSATATPARPSPCSSLAQSEQRIDRPLLRTVRRPDGWCPAPVARLVSVAMLVSGRSQAWTGCPAAHRTPATSVDEYSLPQPPRTWQLYAARRRTNPGPLLPQAPAVSVSMVGVGRHGRRWLVREQGGSAADPAGHSRCGRPEWRPGSGHRDRTAGSSGRPAGLVARGTARQVGGRWWDAASADGHDQAGRSGGSGAGRGHRSWLAG